ncbi:acetyltransferase [Mesorhizobium sp. BH1-1-4]|uniref:acetyltransferase n=1 Tax=Mesorhizobium sp. BH1-1-4 TaxID=2876662 RepID=UPI001CD0A7C3|nr:acetyltransferase [Mesorhizobium sp. BH1-1-4]MBZ9993445.1 acetyltransferase [Mesorhizobium sp. BH1-1-4]
MADVVIFGAGQLAEVAKAYFDKFSEDRVVGFTVDKGFLTQTEFKNLPVVAWEGLEERFPPGTVKLIGPLSYQRLNEFRRDRHREGRARGYDFARFIHPSAHNMAEMVGDNCFILENCTLQPFVRLGEGVIIWSNSHVGHHTTVDDFCFLSSQVGLASGVHIGTCCFIGGQVGVDNGITVGSGTYIESRAMIRRDLPPNSVVRHPFDLPKPYSSDRLKAMKFR